LGHTDCGGVRAFVQHRDRPTVGDFTDNWMSLIEPAARAVDEIHRASDAGYLSRLERASIVRTIDNLVSFARPSTRDICN
jgi:carbonic anhydrase